MQQHPALNNDFFIQVTVSDSEIFSTNNVDLVYLEQRNEVNEELACHSTRIGDIDQAIPFIKKLLPA